MREVNAKWTEDTQNPNSDLVIPGFQPNEPTAHLSGDTEYTKSNLKPLQVGSI